MHFLDCENLERVYIPDTTNDIADDAFDGCNSLVIYTPKGSYAEKFARKHNIPVVVSATSQDILNDVKPNLRVPKKEGWSYTEMGNIAAISCRGI